tara:strand:- start:1541 stop:1894 length:354 start_codon:yes stop_codon:yes gene_type:complete
MIKQGKKGSYNIFYRGLFISSFPIHNDKMIEGYNNEGIDLIEQSLRLNYNLKKQINLYKSFVNMIYNHKKNKKKIPTCDHIYFIKCFLALMKLRVIIENDNNGILIMKRKKNRQKKE